MLIIRDHIDMIMIDVVGSDSWLIGFRERDSREGRGSSTEEEEVVIIYMMSR
jgi:hypothetical protein